MRVGWIAGPKEFVHRLAALKRVGELTSPPVLQAALNLFLIRGDYDRHLARTPRAPQGRLALAHRTVLNRFPIGTAVRAPGGRMGPVGAPARGRVRARARRGRARARRPPLGRRRLLARPADVSAIRVSVARGTLAELEKALEIAGACARDLARQAARQKKGRAKAARDASDAKEAALIQV